MPEYKTRDVPPKERSMELINQIVTVNNYRDFLVDVKDSTFKLKHVDLEFSDICVLRSAFFIEDAGGMGYQNNWKLTDRGRYLLRHVPEDVTLDDEEVEALLSAGVDVFELPTSSAEPWRIREFDVEISPHALARLRDSGLIETDSNPRGHATWWRSDPRLDDIRGILARVVDA